MSNEKSLTVQISTECLKEIKKLAIDNDISPAKQASEILEKMMRNKKSKEGSDTK